MKAAPHIPAVNTSVLSADEAPSMLADAANAPSYFNMIKKRWRLIMLLSTLLFVACLLAILQVPTQYQADVLVVLHPGRLIAPNNAPSGVAPDFKSKLDTLREQVESRRTLTDVLRKRNLLPPNLSNLQEQSLLGSVRKAITLKIDKSSFRLLFEHRDPQTAADVANDLARKYIDENARLRNESLNKTAELIDSQIAHLEAQVKENAESLQRFRLENMGSMPEDVPANQALLISLTNQLAQGESALASDILRRRQLEERLAETIRKEVEQRQIALAKLIHSLNHFQAFIEENGINNVLASLTPPATGTGNTQNVSASTDVPKPEKSSILETAAAAGSFEVDPEVQVLKEQLSIKVLAVKNAEQQLASLADLRRKGMLSEVAFSRAQNDVERAKSELRMQQAQAAMLRASLQDRQKKTESDLAALDQLQQLWNQALLKIQEFENLQRTAAKADAAMLPDDASEQSAIASELSSVRRVQLMLSVSDVRGELGRLTQEFENTISSIARQRNGAIRMKRRMDELDQRLNNSARVQVELPEMLRRNKTLIDQYESMLKYKMQTEMAMSVEDQQEGERMQIWDPAVVPATPSRPNYPFLLAGAIVGSLATALALALLLGSYESILMMSRYLNADDLRAHTGVEILGSIGQVGRVSVPPNVPRSSAPVVALHSPHHPVARQFVDCCCLMLKSGAPRVLAVCSAVPGDGKSFVAANIAAALALTSRTPTLLVDGDLRSPSLHRLFAVRNHLGLSEAADGRQLDIHRLPIQAPADLRLVTAGAARNHSSVVLSGSKVQELLRTLRCGEMRPLIVLDTPALSSGPDADLLLDGVDGVLLVVRRNHTPIADLTRVLRRIPREKLKGILFNYDQPE
ncbi:MAG TPA: P-loop NTPase [Planctomycetota bacterium]|nr:P-loop NTPase [Planctomycetota bacterium]